MSLSNTRPLAAEKISLFTQSCLLLKPFCHFFNVLLLQLLIAYIVSIAETSVGVLSTYCKDCTSTRWPFAPRPLEESRLLPEAVIAQHICLSDSSVKRNSTNTDTSAPNQGRPPELWAAAKLVLFQLLGVDDRSINTVFLLSWRWSNVPCFCLLLPPLHLLPVNLYHQ